MSFCSWNAFRELCAVTPVRDGASAAGGHGGFGEYNAPWNSGTSSYLTRFPSVSALVYVDRLPSVNVSLTDSALELLA
jgi:hypothetical protein